MDLNDIADIKIPPIYKSPPYEPSKLDLHPTKYRVMVMGNGFDLSLGLHTSYKEYAHSEFWPFKDDDYPEGSLPKLLNKYRDLDTWFDLEELLFKHGDRRVVGQMINEKIDLHTYDKKRFVEIRDSFAKYLREEMTSRELNSSPASLVLEMFGRLSGEKSIYTFNYTDVPFLIKKVDLDINVDVTSVHGSLRNQNIILGVGDKHELKDEYFFLHKSAQPQIKSNRLITDLDSADDVIIFGHSLGFNDYDYFMDFFQNSTKERKGLYLPRRRITIFTKNNESELELRKRLMELTARSFIKLHSTCDFSIVCTDDRDSFMSALNNLKQE